MNSTIGICARVSARVSVSGAGKRKLNSMIGTVTVVTVSFAVSVNMNLTSIVRAVYVEMNFIPLIAIVFVLVAELNSTIGLFTAPINANVENAESKLLTISMNIVNAHVAG